MRENKFYTVTGHGDSPTKAVVNLIEGSLDTAIWFLTVNYNDVVIEGVSHDVMTTNTPNLNYPKFEATALIHYTVAKG